MKHDAQVKRKVPISLTITIDLKWCESIKAAKLDIDETSLVFDYPELYYLDLNLKYKCDPSNGNAKFDKSKKTLNIKLPVVGLTEDSQKVMDDHYQKHVLQEQERIQALQTQEEADKEPEKEKEEEQQPEMPERLLQSFGQKGIANK